MGQRSITVSDISGLAGMRNWVESLVTKGLKGGPVIITLSREKRTEAQNRKMWPMLQDISEQATWFDERLRPEEWKDLFTAAVKNLKTVPGIEGGIVVLGMSTSGMKKKEFSELIEYMYAWGSENAVKWSEKSTDIYEQHRDTA